MIKRRRRFKQTVAFKDRLADFAQLIRNEASALPSGRERDDLLMRASRADTAADFDEWAHSAGLTAADVKVRGGAVRDDVSRKCALSPRTKVV